MLLPSALAMSRAINELHEIVVETNESTFVLSADSRDGRLGIQQRWKRGSGAKEQVWSLSPANPEELEAFFDGLRRALSSPGLACAQRFARGDSDAPRAARRCPAGRSGLTSRFASCLSALGNGSTNIELVRGARE